MYQPKKTGMVIPGINLDWYQIDEIVIKVNSGVTRKRICQDYDISYYFLKIIEKMFT